MLTLAMAVLIASLLGSLHCVGMCGPFALWATAGGSSRGTVAAYHAGRLTTYLSAGLAAGVLGSAVTFGGDIAGFQSLSARIAGGSLVLIGLVQLLFMLPIFSSRPVAVAKPSRIAALLQNAKPLMASRGPRSRAYLGGLMTTWLPCGWLYLFVLVAAGTGDVALAMTVMIAFWIGTLPALTAFVFGVHSLLPKIRRLLPIAASFLLIATGLYTATGRASADLSAMHVHSPGLDSPVDATSLLGLADEALPCCQP